MWIVQLALRRPYTFVVVAILVAILGVTAVISMPVDIFPYIDIPVISVVWQYGGLAPEEMEKRMTVSFERSMTTTVNDIEHIESQSYNGVAVIRVYLQPAAKVEMAIAQITAQAQSQLRAFPPGTFPPSVIKYDASAVPILQLGMESDVLAEQQLFDLGNNFIRTQLATVQGISVPLPYGGKFRAVEVDLNPDQMFAKQLTASDVSAALSLQNLILPAGTAKIGDRDYQIKLNSSPRVLAEMNNLPVRVVNGATVFLKDVAQVRDGNTVQTSIVRVNGTRGALLTIMRNGKASTLSVVNAVRHELPKILAGLPNTLHVRELADQSLFVRASVNGVVREAVMAAFLTGLMILLFLGSWRSTTFSVPSLMGSIMCVGVATANSILVVVFADDQRAEGLDARSAALAAGHTRIRPVIMTAAAMIIGMMPMALGMGEGGEQNVPLGRAVIGGLTLATITTLFVVPLVYSLLRRKPPVDFERRIQEEQRSYFRDEMLLREDLR
jgi:multidrug efflux pump subunit AcrB